MKSQAENFDVIVAGGGAAGMMAAGVAAANGKRVLLLEKNAKLGEKLAISGGGRCNILNAQPDAKKLLASYDKAEQFLYSPFSKFGMQETYDFFEALGLPLKVEARNRTFPESERAVDVVTIMRKYLADRKVQIKLRSPVEKIKCKGNHIESVEAGGKLYTADSYIFATGGLSHSETGSTGDGFKWLKDLGHTVERPTPTIVPLKAKEPWVKDVAGVTVEAKITFAVDGVSAFSKAGAILFTHTGLSGPTILNCSGKVAGLFESGEVTASIDLCPSTDLGTLDRNLTELFEQHKNKVLKNVLKEFVPAGMNDVLLEMLPDIASDAKVHSVTKEQRRALVELFKNLPLTITGLMGFEKAVVADGGIPLTEIDTRTMRSLKIDNLFVIGDLLHITRPSGGYSLQLCWTTGYVSGVSV
jgi:predicted Rossmann fold flavoprotein